MRSFHRSFCAVWLASAAVLLVGCGTVRPPSTGSAEPAPWPTQRSVGSTLSDDQAHSIAIHALGLVGTPYRYGGNTPESGFDCSGLIGYVYRNQVGTAPPRTVAQLSGWGQVIDGSELRTGDLVVFGRGRNPSHAGIYVGEGRFVHAPSTGGTVRMDHLESKYWARQNAAFRRP
jgi:cell wall-associated NlpC family hydrolase